MEKTLIDTRTRLKDLPKDTRFKISGYHRRGIFFRLCGGGILTAVSEETSCAVVIHPEVYVEIVSAEAETQAEAV